MNAWDRVRDVLRREKRDIGEAVDEATAKANESLDRRERELAASPEEKLALEQERAAAEDEEFEALRHKIEGGNASTE